MTTAPQARSWLPGLAGALVGIAATAAGVAWVIAQALGAPAGDTLLLLALLPATAVVALAVAVAGAAAAFRLPRLGLAWKFALGQLLVVVIALANIAATAALMFLSDHDLGLLTGLLGISLAVSLTYAVIVSRWLTGGIAQIIDAARLVAAGQLETRVAVRTGDEIEDLAAAFNAMAARLAEARRQEARVERSRREFVEAISHDLRTPLTTIRAVNDAMLDGMADDEPTRQRYLLAVRTELDRMGHMVDDLLELSRIDSGVLELRRELVPLGDLLSDLTTSLQPRALKQGVRLHLDIQADCLVSIDPPRFERVLRNLLDNALRHAGREGTVRVAAVAGPASAVVTIEDDGPGIPPGDLERVFDRFYRGEPARTGDAGAGLGLAIARGLIGAHGGSVTAANCQPHGARFTVTLPA